MSSTETNPRRVAELLIGGAVAALVAVVILWGLVTEKGDDVDPRPTSAPPATAPAEDAGPPPIKQARWRISGFPAGVRWLMTKEDRRAVQAQRRRIAALVRDVYDVLFLHPRERGRMSRARFTARAGSALREAQRLGLPTRARRVKTLHRSARIGIDAVRARRAVASVKVRARARVEQRRVRLLHRSTLWLERSRGRWTVFAFDAQQRPLRA